MVWNIKEILRKRSGGTEIASLLKQMINANAEERPRDADSVIESLRNIKAREDIDKIAIAS
ncbi:MAG: hypothetical protein O2877_00355 [bacterium]|nr:hypothetical protein [bacterium]